MAERLLDLHSKQQERFDEEHGIAVHIFSTVDLTKAAEILKHDLRTIEQRKADINRKRARLSELKSDLSKLKAAVNKPKEVQDALVALSASEASLNLAQTNKHLVDREFELADKNTKLGLQLGKEQGKTELFEKELRDLRAAKAKFREAAAASERQNLHLRSKLKEANSTIKAQENQISALREGLTKFTCKLCDGRNAIKDAANKVVESSAKVKRKFAEITR